jgi:hypothetical protein
MPDPDLSRLETWDTWTILGEPWLDTSIDRETRIAYREELSSRGISGLRLLRHRFIAAGGFWWNIIFGNWTSLTFENMVHGWLLNVVLIVSVAIGYVLHPIIGVISFFGGGWLATKLASRLAKRKREG